MWCPECGREYREGFTECAYCHVALTDMEPSEDPDREGITENVDVSDLTRLAKNIEDYPELQEVLKDASSMEDEPVRRTQRFRSAKERANDMKTSGMTLTSIGVLGIIAVILICTGIIKVNLFGVGAYITYATMFVLFGIFTIVGIRSLLRVPGLNEEAGREEEKINEIENWFKENFDKDKIDMEILSSGEEDTDPYYSRVDLMKEKINEHFMDLDPAFSDHIIENLYQQLYEDKA